MLKLLKTAVYYFFCYFSWCTFFSYFWHLAVK